jgi:WXXGXW repeat (2 copies)
MLLISTSVAAKLPIPSSMKEPRMASTRTLVLPALLLLLALPLAAQARSLDAPKAPPTEPVYEVDPGDRSGYTHVDGHWEWTGDNYMWSPGKWVADKDGSVWVADSWAQRGKKWHLTPGHYESDGSAVTSNAAEASEELESHTDRPDTAAEEAKERLEPVVAKDKDDEMDQVEQKVLAPSKKVAKPKKTSGTHKKKTIAKKQPDYNDPKQFPFHKRD